MNSFDIMIAIWLFIVGLCAGSFLNVVILRGLSGESIVLPPSKCPKCQNRLKWWMNIPVLSYLLLGGKCHYCKNHISIQYPIVEFMTGLFFVSVFMKFLYSVDTIFLILGISMIIVMSVTDIIEKCVLNFHTYVLIMAGIIYNIVLNGWSGLLFSIIGIIAGFIIYELMARSGYLIAGQRAYGEGDTLIAMGIGAYFGWKMLLVSTVLSVVIMAVAVFPGFIRHLFKFGKKETLFAYMGAFSLIIVAFINSKFHFIKTFGASIIYLLTIITVLILCLTQIIKDIKNKSINNDNGFYVMPFGPSMGVSFILIIFFQNEINEFLYNIIKSF